MGDPAEAEIHLNVFCKIIMMLLMMMTMMKLMMTHHHAGVYLCQADNRVGEPAEAEIHLNVLCKMMKMKMKIMLMIMTCYMLVSSFVRLTMGWESGRPSRSRNTPQYPM